MRYRSEHFPLNLAFRVLLRKTENDLVFIATVLPKLLPLFSVSTSRMTIAEDKCGEVSN